VGGEARYAGPAGGRIFEITWAEARHRLLQGGELAWDVLDGKDMVKWLME
jgi:hypothetical protein